MARAHMRSWVKAQGFKSIHSERVILPDSAAFDGKNFYNDEVCEVVKQRYPNAFLPGNPGSPGHWQTMHCVVSISLLTSSRR